MRKKIFKLSLKFIYWLFNESIEKPKPIIIEETVKLDDLKLKITINDKFISKKDLIEQIGFKYGKIVQDYISLSHIEELDDKWNNKNLYFTLKVLIPKEQLINSLDQLYKIHNQ